MPDTDLISYLSRIYSMVYTLRRYHLAKYNEREIMTVFGERQYYPKLYNYFMHVFLMELTSQYENI